MRRIVSLSVLLGLTGFALGCGEGLVTDARDISRMRCAELSQLPDGGQPPDGGVDACGGVTFGPVSVSDEGTVHAAADGGL